MAFGVLPSHQLTWNCKKGQLTKRKVVFLEGSFEGVCRRTTFLLVSWPFCTSMLVGGSTKAHGDKSLGSTQPKYPSSPRKRLSVFGSLLHPVQQGSLHSEPCNLQMAVPNFILVLKKPDMFQMDGGKMEISVKDPCTN